MSRAARVMAFLSVASALVVGSACRRHTPPEFTPSIAPAAPAAPVAPPPGAAPLIPIGVGWPAPRSFPPSTPPEPPRATLDGGQLLAVLRGGADGGSINGDPKGPTAESINAIIRASAPSLQRCFDAAESLATGVDFNVSVAYKIRPSGQATKVEVQGAIPGPVAGCVRSAVENLKFSEFEGNAVTGNFPFSYRRDAPPPPAP